VFLDLAVGYQFMSFTNSFMNMKGNHKKMWINLHQAHVNIDFWFENKKRGNFQAISSCFRPLYNSSLVQNIKLCEKGLVLLLTGWKKKQSVTRDWLCSVFTFIECSHIGPCSKTNKLRPSWFPKPILWEFNFFLM